MVEGRALIEAPTAEGVLSIINGFQIDFCHVSATEPVMTHDGKYISSVRFSNDTTITEVRKCG